MRGPDAGKAGSLDVGLGPRRNSEVQTSPGCLGQARLLRVRLQFCFFGFVLFFPNSEFKPRLCFRSTCSQGRLGVGVGMEDNGGCY